MKKSSIFLILILAQAGLAAAGGARRPVNKAYEQLEYSASGSAEINIPAPARPSASVSGETPANETSFNKGAVPPGSDPATRNDGSGLQGTYFGTFESVFNMGRPAAPEDLAGWFSGRYVYISRPDTLFGSIMIGSPYPSGFWVALPVQQQDPAYYDVLDSTKTALVKSAIKHGHGLAITFPQASGSYTYMGTNGPTIYTMEYRKFEGEIIEKMSADGKAVGYTRYLNNVTPLTAGAPADVPAAVPVSTSAATQASPAKPAAPQPAATQPAAGPKPAGQAPADTNTTLAYPW